jgi:hypothetical protein
MTAVQIVINERHFGELGFPSNWKFPVHDDGTMADISFANWRAKRIIEKCI